ncbi:MAG TPA: alginate lyase family protein, partial [Phycisphaerae bacterium]|nr:alginate lyase family protein [Phycisphaerae bacterium]
MSNPWGQSLEVAQRLNNWTAFNEYFVDSPDITPEFYYRFLVSLLEQTRYMYAIENMGFLAGNWPIIECGGLAQAAIMFPEFKEAPKWWAKVKQLTKMQMRVTVFPDGVQVERSPGYHTWCYGQFNNLRLLGAMNNIELPEGFDKTVKGMYEYRHYKIAYPDRSGEPAMADGSGVSWWVKSGKAAKGSLNSQSLKNLWNLGLVEYETLKKFEKSTPPYTSTELTSAGFYVMRSGWGDKERFLLFDCATPSTAGGHWHSSALDVDIYAFGRPLIVDPGASGYSSVSYLDYFRRARAHNIIEFCSEENRRDPKLIRWLRSKDFCLAEGAVEGPNEASMTRRVLFVGGDYWIIDDLANVPSRHPVITREYWHLNSQSVVAGGKQVQLAFEGSGFKKQCWAGEDGQDLSFYTNDPNTGNILVVPDGSLRYASLMLSADTPCLGYVASYEQLPVPPVKIALRYTTLLYPFEGTKRPDVSFKDGVVKIGKNREGLYMRKGEKTDGDCAFVGKEDGAINRILLVAGSRISGTVQLDVPADFMIATRQGESVEIQLMEGSSKKVNRIELPGLQGVSKVMVNGKTCKISETDGKLVIAGPFEKISPNPDNLDLFWIVK